MQGEGERPSVAGDLTVFGDEAEGSAPLLDVGTTINRYTVLEVLGTGGIGVVYAAYDPDLDRKVALKLLRPGPRSTPRFERRRARLVREAQALARLSHPNVVPVYDVGVYEDRVFVAMEHVEGSTMRRWLRERPRIAVEILDKYMQAGRGLAAAHAADIVHRDFKPDNVLVGQDGRVRVLDFGLATPALDASSSGRLPITDALTRSPRPRDSTQRLGLLDDPITSHGQVMGTPAYMAPEQARGEPPDARADQYSFCVSLWEAISGERPKPREGSTEAIALRKREGMIDVPRHVMRALERGLSPDPSERFPDMTSLLDALERPPRDLRRLSTLALALGFVGVLAFALVREQANASSPCSGAEQALVGVWDDPVRIKLREHLDRGVQGNHDWQAVERQLDRWAKRWTSAREDACKATHERSEQSSELLDQRMACLDRQALEIATLTESLAAPFDRHHTLAARLEQALEAAFELPDPSACEAARLLADEREGEAEDERLDDARAQLARARGLAHAEQLDEALALAESVAAQAATDEQPALHGEASLVIGTLQLRRGEREAASASLRKAVFEGQAAGRDQIIVEACIGLVDLLIELGEVERAADWVALAEASLTRLGGDTRLDAELHRAKALVARDRSDFALALTEQREVLRLREQLLGPDHVDVADALSELAALQTRVNHFPEAQLSIDRALAILSRELGEQHPRYALALNRRGSLQHIRGDDRGALEAHARALDILAASRGETDQALAWIHNDRAIAYYSLAEYEQALAELHEAREILLAGHGGDHPKLGSLLLNIGALEHELGRDDDALASLDAASALIERELGTRHASMGYVHNTRGAVFFGRGDYEAALREYREAQTIFVATMGKDNQIVGVALGNVAKTSHALATTDAQRREALELQREALAIRRGALGDDHAELAEHYLWIGEGELSLGRATEAESVLERGLAASESDAGADPERRARLRHALARTLAEREPARARELVRAALDDLARAKGPSVPSLAADLRAWLREHGG